MRHPAKNVTFLVALFVLGAGCADRKEVPRTPPFGPELGAPRVPWDQKTREERMAFMGAHVSPTMKKLFQKYDAKGYADFQCQTCHGSDMEAVDYRMPNGLYELPADDPIAEAKDVDEDVAEFMVKEVAPMMAKLLSRPKMAEGEACFICHPKDE
jgi:hypothetical protein